MNAIVITGIFNFIKLSLVHLIETRILSISV